MFAFLLLALQQFPDPLPIGYEEQLIHSASGRTTLAYRASSYVDDPVRLEVRRAGESVWKRAIEWPLELATVDDRGWVAGFRWTGVRFLQSGLPSARGRGELSVFDATGAIVARRLALDDEGHSCMTSSTHAFDLVFVDERRLLLRANEFTTRARWRFGECWSLLDAHDLSELGQLAPAQVCGRPATPMWLPYEWGERGELALDVRAIAGAPLLLVRWPFPQWRTILGGVELQEEFTVVDAQARPVLEIAQPATTPRAEPDPEFNLADPRFRAWRRAEWFQPRGEQRFALVRALDGAWIEYRALFSDGVWRVAPGG